MRLKEKIIVVTGGSGLLGKEITTYLEGQGAQVVVGDITVDTSRKNQHHLDITSEDSVRELVSTLLEKHGRIDGWVNNAFPRTRDWGNKFEEVPLKSWKENIDMHLNGYFICCKNVLEQMKKQKSGSLVNIGSIYGVQGPDFNIYEGTEMTSASAYSAIKGGVINFTRYLASYYGRCNVRINTVSPGGIFDNQNPVFVKNYEKNTPLGRMANPADISPGVAFLLSDDAAYITGQNLIIDGGWTAK